MITECNREEESTHVLKMASSFPTLQETSAVAKHVDKWVPSLKMTTNRVDIIPKTFLISLNPLWWVHCKASKYAFLFHLYSMESFQ